jgi:hypothetical protein
MTQGFSMRPHADATPRPSASTPTPLWGGWCGRGRCRTGDPDRKKITQTCVILKGRRSAPFAMVFDRGRRRPAAAIP